MLFVKWRSFCAVLKGFVTLEIISNYFGVNYISCAYKKMLENVELQNRDI